MTSKLDMAYKYSAAQFCHYSGWKGKTIVQMQSVACQLVADVRERARKDSLGVFGRA